MTIRDQRAELQAIAWRAMIEEGLEPEWPAGAAAELARLGDAPTSGLRDLRHLPWSSIDNDDSRDLDQLEVCVDARGRTRLLIAIADVDALVEKDSAIDAHAGESSPYPLAELEALAQHCTKQEDAANRVERLVRKVASALWIADRIGEEFDAVVTGASSKGTWVRLNRPPIEGKLERGFQGLDVGDRVRVRLVDTDAGRGFIDFERV